MKLEYNRDKNQIFSNTPETFTNTDYVLGNKVNCTVV